VLFDAYAKSFDKSLADLEYRAPALIAETVVDIWKDEDDKTVLPRILDLGAGTGLFCSAIKEVK
jgi:predicted TPR repeat methyltransferase